MIRITTRAGNLRLAAGFPTDAVVEFRYDEEGVEIIRSISGRRWNPSARYWTVPEGAVRLTATRFHAAGFDVVIDGKLFTPSSSAPPPRNGSTPEPLRAFFRTLPSPLRQPVYRALSKVLHPDAGGDTALMQELNRANKDTS